jgi:hypothetical protein
VANDKFFQKRKIIQEKDFARRKNQKQRYITLLIVSEVKQNIII